VTSSIRQKVLQESRSALAEFEAGRIRLHEFTRRMEQPIHDARAREEVVDDLLAPWTEIEIVNAITVDEGREPDDEERTTVLEAGERLVEVAAARLH
jgi:hypothetical protein